MIFYSWWSHRKTNTLKHTIYHSITLIWHGIVLVFIGSNQSHKVLWVLVKQAADLASDVFSRKCDKREAWSHSKGQTVNFGLVPSSTISCWLLSRSWLTEPPDSLLTFQSAERLNNHTNLKCTYLSRLGKSYLFCVLLQLN